MSASNPTSVAVVIDTDSYAGNFERALCAFCTGMVGECMVGEELCDDAEENLPTDVFEYLSEHVVHESDDNGCHRPASIWRSEADDNYNSAAIFFDEVPPDHVIEVIMERAKIFAEKRPDDTAWTYDFPPTRSVPKALGLLSLRVMMPKLVAPCRIEFDLVSKRPFN